MMRIGVVCEGPSDYHAIESFFRHSLGSEGISAEFKALQPDMDRTQPEAGWGHVLLWLKKNPPASRIQNYFSGGLFGGGLATPSYDCILIQLDSDVLGEEGFCKFVSDEYGIAADCPDGAESRADVVRVIIEVACQFEHMANADRLKHIPAPAVESTEAWCVAAFRPVREDFELLSGQVLTDAFMSALETSESRAPTPPYARVDKSAKRRQKFCETHAPGSARIVAGCSQFKKTHELLVALA